MSDPNVDYPEQRHAGAVGYGPDYKKGASGGDKMSGLVEEVKGKVTRNPERVQHGRDLRTGELKKREQEKYEDEDPLTNADDEEQPSAPSTAVDESDAGRERAATIAPAGTDDVERQRTGNEGRARMMNQ